jgi:hypothetical protein
LAAIYQVDLNNYERSCLVYQNECKASPKKDKNGIDTDDHGNYSAPVHAVIGMAGFTLDKFSNHMNRSQISSKSTSSSYPILVPFPIFRENFMKNIKKNPTQQMPYI